MPLRLGSMQAEAPLPDRNGLLAAAVDAIYQGHCQTVTSNAYEVERAIADADLVIGAVLVPGKAPTFWSPTSRFSRMKFGLCLYGIYFDSRVVQLRRLPRHDARRLTLQGLQLGVSSCGANMPGAVLYTSTPRAGLNDSAACRGARQPRSRRKAASPTSRWRSARNTHDGQRSLHLAWRLRSARGSHH